MTRHARHRRKGGRTPGRLALVLLVSFPACGGGGDPVTLNWDLSASHTKEDIGEEPDPETNHYGIRSVESIRVALPGDRIFEADDVQDIRISAEGDDVEEIGVVLHPRTAEDAHARAVALAGQWDLRREGLDEWLQQVRSVREQDEDQDEASVGQALATDKVPGVAAFAPSVEIRYSFDDEKPWVVAFNMYWDPEVE